MLLFTMEQQDLYIDLKTTMTRKSKKLGSRNVSASKHKIGHGSTILYEKWKRDYEEKFDVQYKWPVFQLLL